MSLVHHDGFEYVLTMHLGGFRHVVGLGGCAGKGQDGCRDEEHRCGV